MGGKGEAQAVAAALRTIDRPTLMLAHTAGNGERLPGKAFGSVANRDLVSRLAYAVAKLSESGVRAGGGALVEPTRLRVEMKQTKSNNYPDVPNRFIEMTTYPDGTHTMDFGAKSPEAVGKTNADLAAEVLGTGGSLEVASIVRMLRDVYGREVSEENLRKALKGDVRFVSSGTRPLVWRVVP